MNPTEHPPHSSRTEIKLQWIAIACMALGLIASIYFHASILKAERIENELSSYLHLNDKYHSLLFKLIDNDPEVFQKKDNASLQKNKYIIYELFELFSTIESVEVYFSQLNEDVWPCWKRRLKFLLSKPAVQHAWASRRHYAEHIYEPEFVAHVEKVLATHLSSTTVANLDD
jgi:hypothetical protein